MKTLEHTSWIGEVGTCIRRTMAFAYLCVASLACPLHLSAITYTVTDVNDQLVFNLPPGVLGTLSDGGIFLSGGWHFDFLRNTFFFQETTDPAHYDVLNFHAINAPWGNLASWVRDETVDQIRFDFPNFPTGGFDSFIVTELDVTLFDPQGVAYDLKFSDQEGPASGGTVPDSPLGILAGLPVMLVGLHWFRSLRGRKSAA